MDAAMKSRTGTADARGVGSRPMTGATLTVKPTAMGGTVEKLEQGMTGIYSGCRPTTCMRITPDGKPCKNTILGESFSNIPSRTASWRPPKTSLHPTELAPQRGGRQNPNLDLSKRPFTPFTVTTKGRLSLKTKNHTNAGYHGVMFTIEAKGKSLRICNLHSACVHKTVRELYRVYIKEGGLEDGASDPTRWREVSAGEAELPVMTGVYGAVPFPVDGVKLQAEERMSIYIHCPYNKCGIAFRRFSRAWPGYPGLSHVTDANQHFSVLCARATYSQTPFERVSAEGCAFAGLIEYDFSMDFLEEFLATKASATSDANQGGDAAQAAPTDSAANSANVASVVRATSNAPKK